MKTQYAAAAALVLSLAVAGPSPGAVSGGQFAKKGPAKSRPAVATRTVTLDITHME